MFLNGVVEDVLIKCFSIEEVWNWIHVIGWWSEMVCLNGEFDGMLDSDSWEACVCLFLGGASCI